MDFSFLTRHSKLFLLLSIIVVITFGSFAPFVQTVNNVDYFRLQDHPDHKFYKQFQDVFGNEEFFIIAFEKKDIFTSYNLQLLKKITTELEGLELARDVLSLANVDNIIGEEEFFYVQPFLDEIPESQLGLERMRKEAVENSLYKNNLISADGKTAAILIFAYDRPNDPDYRQKLIRQTKNLLEPYSHETNFYLAGWTITNYSLSQYMQRDLAVFIPITYLLIALVTFLFFRNIRLTFLADCHSAYIYTSGKSYPGYIQGQKRSLGQSFKPSRGTMFADHFDYYCWFFVPVYQRS